MLLDEKIVIAETLLSHYKTVKNIQDGQMKEFLDYIYKTLPSIYAAFVNKGCISKGDTQNIVSNYITLIKKTTKSMENAVYDAKKNRKEKDLLHRLYKIICMLYINKTPVSKKRICQKLEISYTHFNRYHHKALETFFNFMEPIANRMGYQLNYSGLELPTLVNSAEKRLTKIKECS